MELEAYVAMDNHFHIVCKVVRGGDALPEGELIRRVAALKGERAAEDLASHWEELRGIGMDSAVVEAQDRLRARMNDVSEFIKTFTSASAATAARYGTAASSRPLSRTVATAQSACATST